MSEVVYRSEVLIERVKGPVRMAYLPAESKPVIFGAVALQGSAVAEPRDNARLHWLPLRHVHRRRPLEARWRRVKFDASGERLVGDAVGEGDWRTATGLQKEIRLARRLTSPRGWKNKLATEEIVPARTLTLPTERLPCGPLSEKCRFHAQWHQFPGASWLVHESRPHLLLQVKASEGGQ